MAKDNKKIINIEILHLDELGYGPDGNHTRRQWRAECFESLLLGNKSDFLLWQQTLFNIKNDKREYVDFSLKLNFSDGTTEQRKYLNSPVALDFSAQVFADDLNVAGYDFLQYVQFNFAIFKGRVWTNNIVFKSDAMFSKAVFELDAWFNNATFKGDVVFSNAVFMHDASFHDASFNKTAIFSQCDFEGDAIFCDASFMRDTDFNKAIFKGDWNRGKVDFRDVFFHGDAHFDESIFECDARFQEAIFEGNAMFDQATFAVDAWFDKAKFENRSLFIAVKFHGKVHFENAKFNNVGHFESATFDSVTSKIPSFRGCLIDGTRLEFSDDTHFTNQDFSEDAIKNISFLKRLADEHGQTDQALNFNAMELRAKRQYELSLLKPESHQDAEFLSGLLSWRYWIRFSALFKEKFWFCVFTWLYEITSDFGRSFLRPLASIIVINLLTFAICLSFAVQYVPKLEVESELNSFISRLDKPKFVGNISISGWRAATEYSLYRTGNFLDFSDADKHTEVINQRLFNSDIEPTGMRIYGFLKGLISAFLLFLFALGLRNKYRIG